LLLALASSVSACASDIYVSPQGDDAGSGNIDKPIATLAHAQDLARAASQAGSAVTVWLRGGVYHLTLPLVFTAADSGTSSAPVVYRAYKGEEPVISGGIKVLGLKWSPYKGGIMQATVPDDLKTDQLFINGQRRIMARYPNYDPKQRIFNGYSADAISPARTALWADPAGGFFHVMHDDSWNSYSYEINGKQPDGQVIYEGGGKVTAGGQALLSDSLEQFPTFILSTGLWKISSKNLTHPTSGFSTRTHYAKKADQRHRKTYAHAVKVRHFSHGEG
jgi:hypothetical protein